MTIVALIPILVAVIGLIVWLIASNPGGTPPRASPRLADIGRIAFIIGFFWTVSVFAHETLHIGDSGPALHDHR